MRKLSLITAGVAVLGLALGAAAVSRLAPVNVTTIRYPDGSVERIVQAGGAVPVQTTASETRAFAEMERLSAAMDREAAMMLRDAAPGMALAHEGPSFPVLVGAAPGVRGYSVVTTVRGGHVCTRTTEFGPATGEAVSRVLTRVSGDCGNVAAPTPESPALRIGPPRPRLPVA